MKWLLITFLFLGGCEALQSLEKHDRVTKVTCIHEQPDGTTMACTFEGDIRNNESDASVEVTK